MLCSRVISKQRLEEDRKICKDFSRKKFGRLYCIPNMHLHFHLKECVLDYGPISFLWCISFKCFNGILGKLNNNNKQTTEVQIMRQFEQNQQFSLRWTCDGEYGAEFASISQGRMVGTSSHDDTTEELYVKHNVLCHQKDFSRKTVPWHHSLHSTGIIGIA